MLLFWKWNKNIINKIVKNVKRSSILWPYKKDGVRKYCHGQFVIRCIDPTFILGMRMGSWGCDGQAKEICNNAASSDKPRGGRAT